MCVSETMTSSLRTVSEGRTTARLNISGDWRLLLLLLVVVVRVDSTCFIASYVKWCFACAAWSVDAAGAAGSRFSASTFFMYFFMMPEMLLLSLEPRRRLLLLLLALSVLVRTVLAPLRRCFFFASDAVSAAAFEVLLLVTLRLVETEDDASANVTLGDVLAAMVLDSALSSLRLPVTVVDVCSTRTLLSRSCCAMRSSSRNLLYLDTGERNALLLLLLAADALPCAACSAIASIDARRLLRVRVECSPFFAHTVENSKMGV